MVNAIDCEDFSRVIHSHLDFGIFPMLRQLSIPLVQTSRFFCQSHITPPPRDPRNFKCPHCQCWNRYDARGEITSDEPAMHEPGMNARSFARRGEILVPPQRYPELMLVQRHPGRTDFYQVMARLFSATPAKQIKYVLYHPRPEPAGQSTLTSPPPDVTNEPPGQLPPIPRGSFRSTPSLANIHNPHRIQNTPPDSHLSPHTKLPSNYATHPYVQTASPRSRRKYDQGTTWPARVLSDTG